MIINNRTKVYISLAKSAGNFGCTIHNAAFQYHNINSLYKSFSIDNLDDAIKGIKAFKISGAGVTMPYKMEIIKYLDEASPEVIQTGSCNTVILNEHNRLIGYNTDCYSTRIILSKYRDIYSKLFILGDGGFSKAVQYSAEQLKFDFEIITRSNWYKIKSVDSLVFNCTPVENIIIPSGLNYIDCLINTSSGQDLSILQASKQFELYTGIKFPIDYISSQLSLLLTKTAEY